MSDGGLEAGWNRLAAALERTTRRERWLAAIAFLAALGVLAFEASTWASDQRTRYQTALADLSLARQRRAERITSAPNAAEIAQAGDISSWSQHGRSIWLARLKIEQRIVFAASGSGLKDVQVRLAEAPEGSAALPVLRAEVSGTYHGAALVGLLQRLSDDPETYVVDKLEVSQADAPEFKLSLLVPVVVDGSGR